MAITEDESKLIAIFVQSCLWGAFAVLFIITYWTLVHNRPFHRPLNKSMLSVAILMFIIATMQLGINFTRVIRAFTIFKESSGDYWNRLSEFTQIFGSTMYITQTFVGDGVVIYRTYVVWNRRLHFIVIPGIIYLGSLVTGISTLATMGQTSDSVIIFASRLPHWIASFFACTLATSVICTIMIALRIWYLDRTRASGAASKGTFHPAARVILESGAIYSSVLIALLGTFLADSWFQYVLVDSLSPLIGIVFSIIIVRIGLGIATDPEMAPEVALPRVPWPGSQRPGPHELSTFAASADIEQPKGMEVESVRLSVSGDTEVGHRGANKNATHMN